MEIKDSKLELLISEIEKVRRRKVINYTDETTSINYLDPFKNLEKIKISNNHLILGRRGSGKTTLLLSTIKSNKTEDFVLPIDCQIFRDWNANKIKLHILRQILQNLKSHFENCKTYTQEIKLQKGFINKIKYKISNFRKISKLDELNYFLITIKKTEYLLKVIEELPEEPISININKSNKVSEVKNVITSFEAKTSSKFKSNANIPVSIVNLDGEIEMAFSASKNYKKEKTNETKTSQQYDFKKVISKEEKIAELIFLFSDIFNEFNRISNNKIILYLDDFYLVSMDSQPQVIQYFHDIYKNSKNDSFCFKLCSIPNRTKINFEGKVDFSLKDDFSPIRLDKELYDFDNLVEYLLQITANLSPSLEINSHDIRTLFVNDEVLKFTVVATGGVPRDFLVILSEILRIALSENSNRIKKEHLYSAISDLKQDKEQNIEVECDIPVDKIREALSIIHKEVIDGLKTNVILYPEHLAKAHESLLKNLINLRYLHVINETTSSERVKKENFVSYLVDMTFYATGKRLKQNFDFREFWVQDSGHRHTNLRTAPIWHFKDEFARNN